jgi:hypothetical protein
MLNMHSNSINHFNIIIFDYQVVIIKITIISYEPHAIALLRNDSSEQASPVSEGVTEISINSHLARENNLTTQHT